MTYDARYIYQYVTTNDMRDWQSPVMTVLWLFIDPVAPGPASMFLLIVMFYWLALGLLAFTFARHSIWLAVLLLLLAVSPPAFAFIGTIWRDVLFASTWLLAAALAFVAAKQGPGLRVPMQAIALLLLALGVLIRPNAIIAAPILGVAIVWPTSFSWKRTAVILVPAAVVLFALVQLVYYGVLGAKREHAVQSIMVFDLGGISHFAKQNQFPGTWSESEARQITTGCYQPTDWDIYWTRDPCKFVMDRLKRDELFGSPAIPDAWKRAVANHPIAYLQHRAEFMGNFLASSNLTMWTYDVYDTTKFVFEDRLAYPVLVKLHNILKSTTPLFRAGAWLLVCMAVCAFGWRRRNTSAGVFAIGVCGSAIVYVLTFFAVGVASDFRYAYWAVLAGIAGGVAVALERKTPITPP